MDFFFFEDSGYYYPTAAGKTALIVLAVLAVLAAAMFVSRSAAGSGQDSQPEPKTEKKLLSPKQLACCAMSLALAFATSYVTLFRMPYGGSITLFSMLFICFVGYCYGLKAGLLTGFAYSIMQFMQDPYILTPFQVCCDYFLAFTALGLAGLFARSKHGLIKGYILGALVRGLFHTIGGYLYWMEYMPETFPKTLTAVYPIVYNYSFIGAEMVLTLIVLAIPAVSKALARIKKTIS